MSEQKKMQLYFQRTKIKNYDRYCLRLKEALALYELSKTDVYEALVLAFEFGMAKGYRARKNERGVV